MHKMLALIMFVLLAPLAWRASGQSDSTLQSTERPVVSGDVRIISTPPKDRYDKAAVWINVGLALIGLTGIGVALRTLGKIERQIKVAEADTQAMVRTERAWIVISVESPSPGVFHFYATNEGRTPAQVLSIWSSPIAVRRDEVLSVPADHETNESLVSTPPCLLPPHARSLVFRYKVEDLFGKDDLHQSVLTAVQLSLRKGTSSIYLYGRIRYSNVLSSAPSIHESKWLYWHIPVEGATPFPDPMRPEYNIYT